MDIHHLRQEYLQRALAREDLLASPYAQFDLWFQEALKAQVTEPNGMALATATLAGVPSCRLVLMKAFDEKGVIFFTNIYSRKAQDLALNPQAAATFWWKELERQVHIAGSVTALDQAEARAYFAERPRTSQLGTRSSRQSEKIPSREFVEKERQRLDRLYSGLEVPMPADWGGYRLHPQKFEFWQGRACRLHDRFIYLAAADGWTIDRLSP